MLLKIVVLLVALDLSVSRPERLYTQPSFGPRSTPLTIRPTPRAPSSGAKNTPVPTPSGPANPFNISFVVSVKDLPVKKKGATADAYVKLFYRTGTIKEQPDWTSIGQTETVKGSNSPSFLKVFTFEWTRGKNQQFHFEVKGHHSITKDDALGQADYSVDEYVLQKSQAATVKLSDGGTISINKVEPVKFRLYARTVPKLDPLSGASDPFVVCFWRVGKNGTDTKFYTTKVVKDSENPDWNETIEFPNYQKGVDMWWNFKVYDEDSVGNDLIGEALVEIDPFVTKRSAKPIQLSKDPKNKSTLTVTPA